MRWHPRGYGGERRSPIDRRHDLNRCDTNRRSPKRKQLLGQGRRLRLGPSHHDRYASERSMVSHDAT